MRDFSLEIYRELLETLQAKGYELISYSDYCRRLSNPQSPITNHQSPVPDKFLILRHDVDKLPKNSLRTAQIERAIGAKASYYFRVGKESNNPEVIRAIVRLGHEIGYHYEDMALCNGDVDAAYDHFKTWLEYFRYYYAVETICMHGAPTSRYDGRDLWKKYSYKDLGIIAEPYLDTDFSDVFYLTDTGRCWDGYTVSVRDKIPQYQDQWTAAGLTWHTTPELIEAIRQDLLPPHVMMTTHPQRWTDNTILWWKERILQNTKNSIKRIIVKQK